MGADPDARSPDFRVPDEVKRDDGLREREEESSDATDTRRRSEEPKNAASRHGGSETGKSELPNAETGPAERSSHQETSTHRLYKRQSRGEAETNNQRDIKEEKHTKTPNDYCKNS
ncbi:hypothetical protein NDU88_002343 [Pleurodeles waltl]|uniref:Uncharacterized protein n=1 Tax=Pleurodeles waltl TaxID=8319 RepID=A0AAV7RAN7_PLEWA|nr:hypothetical protein NDU88_002343 [Pleurodeles waltl]